MHYCSCFKQIRSKIAAVRRNGGRPLWFPPGTEEILANSRSTYSWCGPKTATLLGDKGFHTVADIQRASVVQMSALLGEAGLHLSRIADGGGPDELTVDRERKSISREETFDHDIDDFGHFSSPSFAFRGCLLDSSLLPLESKEVTLKLRYADFETLTRAVTIEPTDDDTVVLDLSPDYCAQRIRGKSRSDYWESGCRISAGVKGRNLVFFPATGDVHRCSMLSISCVKNLATHVFTSES